MGTFRLTKDFIDYEILSATSQVGAYLATNLLNREYPKRAWRSGSLDSQEIEIDLLSARQDPEIHIEITNASEIEYVGSNDGESWNGAEGEITVERDEKQGVYRYGGKIEGFNHRYIKIIIPNQTPTDGASYYSIGTLSFMASTTALVANPRMGLAYAEDARDGHVVNTFDTGADEVLSLTNLMPLSIQLNLRQPFANGSSGLIWDLFRSKKTIVYVNFGLGKSWQAYLVRRTTPIREARDAYSYVQFDNLTVKLVV